MECEVKRKYGIEDASQASCPFISSSATFHSSSCCDNKQPWRGLGQYLGLAVLCISLHLCIQPSTLGHSSTCGNLETQKIHTAGATSDPWWFGRWVTCTPLQRVPTGTVERPQKPTAVTISTILPWIRLPSCRSTVPVKCLWVPFPK